MLAFPCKPLIAPSAVTTELIIWGGWVKEQIPTKLKKVSGRVFSFNPASVETAWKNIKIATKIENLHLHDLRHESLSRLGDLGLSSSELKKFSGHKHSDSQDRYVHLDEFSLAQKLQKLSIVS